MRFAVTQNIDVLETPRAWGAQLYGCIQIPRHEGISLQRVGPYPTWIDDKLHPFPPRLPAQCPQWSQTFHTLQKPVGCAGCRPALPDKRLTEPESWVISKNSGAACGWNKGLKQLLLLLLVPYLQYQTPDPHLLSLLAWVQQFHPLEHQVWLQVQAEKMTEPA